MKLSDLVKKEERNAIRKGSVGKFALVPKQENLTDLTAVLVGLNAKFCRVRDGKGLRAQEEGNKKKAEASYRF